MNLLKTFKTSCGCSAGLFNQPVDIKLSNCFATSISLQNKAISLENILASLIILNKKGSNQIEQEIVEKQNQITNHKENIQILAWKLNNHHYAKQLETYIENYNHHLFNK